ncbi:adenosylcobinamide-GDP ribazoletransferase [Moraxella pluranimalium]|uniref:Adenosylcobinamide-GDP ribazoletransferase n=1 Tax=Moraxella pluranimalium TaxID=470453 RepID=A0A1T0CJN3_9GAMM|nr:adenosylcobinamide-GDP ribazoletransferase [Moraxella pluranimalium]OOS22469.1 adenosylcobinamide-GDP ribazoletransferase [Moraxella pluranimalium]
MIPLLIAVQFMTTVPVRLPYLPSREQNALSMLFYPVIGLLIGGVLWLMASFIHLPIMLLSCLIVVAWVGLTGGLHLDGLADTADAWVGGFGDRERTLAIMKDPNAGAMGVIAIVLCLMLKWASVYGLLMLDDEYDVSFVWLMIPMLGRLGVLVLFATTPYVRQQGLGSALQDVPKFLLWLVVVGFGVMLGVLSWQLAVVMLGVWVVMLSWLRWRFVGRLGGITGDTVGASIEMVEVAMLVSVVAVLYGGWMA